MSSFLFILGRTPKLAAVELASLLNPTSEIIPGVVRADDAEIDPVSFMARLGGTVKIGEIVATMPELTPEALLPHIDAAGGTFGISVYGNRAPNGLVQSMKKELTKSGIHARFVMPKEGNELSSVVVAKQNVQELLCVAHKGEWVIAKTRAVQDFEAWNKRDYGRPAVDAQAGMLPPKVARMVVNIAAGQTALPHPRIYDPFCGMGTIVAEALMIGANALGSDVSQEAVDGAAKNISWLRKEYTTLASLEGRVFTSDAVHVTEKLTAGSVDAIATEPFMGSTQIAKNPSIDPEKVRNTLKGLEKLYIGSLKEWAKILKSGGIVVMAMPIYVVGGKEYTVKKVIDMCETLGYTRQVGPIEYSRPQAVVKRGFYVLKKS